MQGRMTVPHIQQDRKSSHWGMLLCSKGLAHLLCLLNPWLQGWLHDYVIPRTTIQANVTKILSKAQHKAGTNDEKEHPMPSLSQPSGRMLYSARQADSDYKGWGHDACLLAWSRPPRQVSKTLRAHPVFIVVALCTRSKSSVPHCSSLKSCVCQWLLFQY